MKCPACQLGLSPAECFKPGGELCKDESPVVVATPAQVVEVDESRTDKKRKRKHKLDTEVRDAKSTGRKRAAQLVPLKDEEGNPVVCSWAGLKFAGGGEYPIVGCIIPGRPATNRHHGPDKDTLKNFPGTNLHAICTYCHNRWHALNDPGYVEYISRVGGLDKIRPHDSETRATVEEMVQNEQRWLIR